MSSMVRTCVALMLSVFALPAHCSEPKPIRFAVNTYWAAPYGDIQGTRLVGGILFDLAQALEKTTHRKIVQVPLPRKRMEVGAAEGLYDMHCFFNPAWSDSPDLYTWSDPMFEESSVLIGHASTKPLNSTGELPRGTIVNTVLGNKESIDLLFENGQLRRDDTTSEQAALQKTSLGHNRYALVHQLMVRQFLHDNPKAQLASWELVVAQNDFYCAIPTKSAIPAQELLGALRQIKSDGMMASILARY